MTIISERDRVRALLANWSAYSRDCTPDFSEVYYYVISPDFAGTPCTANNNPPAPAYDTESAQMVERVFREMFGCAKADRELLIKYYTREHSSGSFAESNNMSRRQLFRLLDAALDEFYRVWRIVIRRT